mgnify:CR=1 FL=1
MGPSENKIPTVPGFSDFAGIVVWSIYRIAPVLRTGQGDELFRRIGEFVRRYLRIWNWQQAHTQPKTSTALLKAQYISHHTRSSLQGRWSGIAGLARLMQG